MSKNVRFNITLLRVKRGCEISFTDVEFKNSSTLNNTDKAISYLIFPQVLITDRVDERQFSTIVRDLYICLCRLNVMIL